MSGIQCLVLESYEEVQSTCLVEDHSETIIPLWIKEKYPRQNIIWVDTEKSEIGFSGMTKCRIFNLHDIVQIRICNILPAKGMGGAELILLLDNRKFAFETRSIFFIHPVHIFNCYIEQIRKLAQIDTVLLEDIYDC